MSAIFKLSYGLFVLSAQDEGKDNGCIINTAMQVTDSPLQMSICVNNSNYTTEMIKKTGKFNVSILSQEAKFETFQRFGFQSGRSADKLDGVSNVERTENGIFYWNEGVNAVLSGEVKKVIDIGTHSLFVAEISEQKLLNDVPSATYQYYFDNIKPKPQSEATKEKGYVCSICGYVYKGDKLPEGYVCPVCKHGADVFKPL